MDLDGRNFMPYAEACDVGTWIIYRRWITLYLARADWRTVSAETHGSKTIAPMLESFVRRMSGGARDFIWHDPQAENPRNATHHTAGPKTSKHM